MLRMDVRNSFALQNLTEYPKVLCITMKVYSIWLNSSKRTIQSGNLGGYTHFLGSISQVTCFDGFELPYEAKYIRLLLGGVNMLFNEYSVLRINRVGAPLQCEESLRSLVQKVNMMHFPNFFTRLA